MFVTVGSEDPPGVATNISHRYLVLTPAPGFSGTTTLFLNFTDGFNTVTHPLRVTVNPVDDPPGPIELVEPEPQKVFVPGQPLTLEARVRNSESDFLRVEFYNRETRLGSVAAPPYRFVWSQPPEGAQPVTAVAVDAAGQRTESSEVIFQIGEQHESPPFLALRSEGNFVTLSWDTDGRDMRVQVSSRLGPGAVWTNITVGLSTGIGNTMTLRRDPSGARFYRLIEVP